MLFETLAKKEKYNEAFAFVTIIGFSGTVSRREGRMAVFPDGTTEGTIGGGEHESEAKKLALEALESGKGRRARIRVSEHGEIEVMIDVAIKEKRILIIGAGHVGKAIYDEFHHLGWHVSVVDTRDTILNEESFPLAERIICSSVLDGVKRALINSHTAVVITTPNELDNIKEELNSSSAFYIGVLSSRKRRSPEGERWHLPMGFDIGAETPEEIAVSTAGEILASFSKRSGLPCSRRKPLVVVRGAGDLATGAITALHRAGYDVVATEVEKPTVIRRTVAFAEALYTGSMTIEGVKCTVAESAEDCRNILKMGEVALIADKDGNIIKEMKPTVVVDAILAKKNLGTKLDMAPFVVALGPGFTAGVDSSVVIETMRGHNLARIIYSGSALPNTGVPGLIAGCGKERVMHTPTSGVFKENAKIGDIVKKGDIIAWVDSTPVYASIDGKLRGLLHSGLSVPEHFKAADIDPRGEEVDHATISDKARAIGNSVVVAVDEFFSSYEK